LTSPSANRAQVEFGAGPLITDRESRDTSKTWFLIMTLAWSRHPYAELVRDQSVATWLTCHRHAFECFGLIDLSDIRSQTTVTDHPAETQR
jgi:transposase